MSGPHESRGVLRPPFRHSHEGSPELIRLDALFPETPVIKSFRTFDDRIGCDKGVDHFSSCIEISTSDTTMTDFSLLTLMDRVQRTFRNFKKANEDFQRASARYKNLTKRAQGWLIAASVSHYIRPNFAQERTRNIGSLKSAHQNMLNTYQRRTNTGSAFRSAVNGIQIRNKNKMNAYQIMNAINRMYAPPSSHGGFGGIEYEAAALRWRKKPNRAKSASPARRRSPLKRAHSTT